MLVERVEPSHPSLAIVHANLNNLLRRGTPLAAHAVEPPAGGWYGGYKAHWGPEGEGDGVVMREGLARAAGAKKKGKKGKAKGKGKSKSPKRR